MDIEVLRNRAAAAIELGKYKFAIKLIHEILSHRPNDEEMFYLLAQAHFLQKQYDKAEDSIKKALSYNPNCDNYLGTYSVILYKKKDYIKSKQVADSVLAINPKNVTAMTSKLYSFCEFKEYEKAESMVKNLLKLEPNDPLYHRILADIYCNTKRHELAKEEYLESLKLEPNNAITLNNYAILLINKTFFPTKKNTSEAQNLLKSSLAINPDDDTVINNYKYCDQMPAFTLCKIVFLLSGTFFLSMAFFYFIFEILGISCGNLITEIYIKFKEACPIIFKLFLLYIIYFLPTTSDDKEKSWF